jgi:hypothetical protein
VPAAMGRHPSSLKLRRAKRWPTLLLVENPKMDVGAGFIPARQPMRLLMRAGINPAPTRLVDSNPLLFDFPLQFFDIHLGNTDTIPY